MLRILCISIILFTISIRASSQIAGRWTSIDDKSGQPRSVVEITERTGKFFGKVVKIHPKPGEDADPVCDKCGEDDPRFGQKIIGMEILKDLIKEGKEFTGGHILDPENGKVYRCKVWLEGKVLRVRGYWGPFFRTQTWQQEAVRP
jgi:uncharacterized protein (DUF2147 family)